MESKKYTATENDAEIIRTLKQQSSPLQIQSTNSFVEKALNGRKIYNLLQSHMNEMAELHLVLISFSEVQLNDIILNIMLMFELKKMTQHIVRNYEKWKLAPKLSEMMFSNYVDISERDKEEIIESEYSQLLTMLFAFKVKYDTSKISQVQKIYAGLVQDLMQKSTKPFP